MYNTRHSKIHVIGVSEKEEREKWTENIFDEIMAEILPNLKKETDIHVQKVKRVPNKMNSNRPIARHIIIKIAQVKDKREC